MKPNLSFRVGLIVVLLVSICANAAQQSKIPQAAWDKARKEGVVRVIVRLNLRIGTGQLDSDTVKDRLITQLQGTTYKTVHRLESFPSIVLEVGPDALAVLEASDLVLRVSGNKQGSLH
jgi:hypothetical protein